ncbi:MAG: hypothetical protein QMD10_12815, partial [Desulfitobacteriaceae bacterium]|nr:hypothetical protein [Desulfitobacteriaceae bacterium]
ELEMLLARQKVLGVAKAIGLGNGIVWVEEGESGALGFSFHPVTNGKETKVVAFVTIYFPQMVLRGFKLIKGSGRLVLASPSERVVIKEKETYRPTVGLTDELYEALQKDCLRAYSQFVKVKKSGN